MIFKERYTNSCKYKPKFISGSLDVCDFLQAFQKLASDHIEKLNMGKKYEEENSFLYIITRMKLYINKEIEEKEYTLVTQIVQPQGLKVYRYAYLLDENGDILCYLISLFSLISRETRRLIKLNFYRDKIKEELDEIEEQHGLTDEELYKIDIEGDLIEKGEYTVVKGDIDYNGHMNNTVYAKVAQLNIAEPFKVFEINFERECFLDEKIKLYSCIEGLKEFIVGKKEDQSISFVASFSN